MSALAVNTHCAGVTIIREPDPDYDDGWFESHEKNNNIRKQNAFWHLHLDYSPGQTTFFWTLYPYKIGEDMQFAGPPISGEGNTPKVGDQIYIAVTKRGANIP
jgi:hypothetical protein